MPTPNRTSVLDKANKDYRADLVAVDETRIAVTVWPAGRLEPMLIEIEGAPGDLPLEALQFLVAMTAINYRFWSLNADGSLSRYRHQGQSGAHALRTAFEQAWTDSSTEFADRFHREPFHELFGAIPDPDSRRAILRDILAGDRLAAVCAEIEQDVAERRAVLASHGGLLADVFPTAFGDPYLKKAQLAIAMYAGFLRNTGLEVDAADLTAMADYQVPRVLRAIGALTYSPALAAKVDAGQLIARDSTEENAIRAATVLACEKIAAQLGATAADVDNLLWQSQALASDTPFHLVQTTWY